MAVVASPIVDQLINPAAKPTHYPFSFDDFLKKEYRFGIPSDRPGKSTSDCTKPTSVNTCAISKIQIRLAADG